MDTSGLQVSVAEKQSEMPFLSKIGVPCVITDAETSRYGFDNYQQSELDLMKNAAIEGLLVGPDAPYRQCMKPEFMRLAPPLHVAENEVENFTTKTHKILSTLSITTSISLYKAHMASFKRVST